MKKMLLHGCCADCSLKFIESIKDRKQFEIDVYYYNPNIHPRSEYQSRLKAMQDTVGRAGIKLIIPDWKPSEYFDQVGEGKKPQRCINCWNLRIGKTAEYAVKNDYQIFSTTLISSQYQNRKKVEEIGKQWAKKFNIEFMMIKNIKSELKTVGFYKQFFCGCVYSLKERFEEKYE